MGAQPNIFARGAAPWDVCVVGAGPAGLAAAVAARAAGAARVLVLERDSAPGGVLPQCVHDGFGLHLYEDSLTGPEYAKRWVSALGGAGATLVCNTAVLELEQVDERGLEQACMRVHCAGGVVSARAVVVATGCRERTRGQLMLPGTRPSGVFTAGTAQYLVNRCNQLPGDKVVILGSGDIGLIMARRLTLEGAQVRLVLGQVATGLLRNHVRCIEDFNIPIRFGWGVTGIHGVGSLKGVSVAPLRPDGSFMNEGRQYIRCNALLLACGLIPETEVLDGVDLAHAPVVVCGNAKVPHDLADQVTQEGLQAGLAAARMAGVEHARLPKDLAALVRKEVHEPKGRLTDIAGLSDAASGTQENVRYIPCTVCPTGCIMRVDGPGRIQGNACARGAAFAKAELSQPMRLFTGTVKIEGSPRLLPVRTAHDVPRTAIMRVARACRRIVASSRTEFGDVVQANIANTGVDLIACSSAEEVCA